MGADGDAMKALDLASLVDPDKRTP